jgi:ppGpp synthetase/RelA/SpoT-type nucleotidyltranferase
MIVPSDIRRAFEFSETYVTQIEQRVRDIVLSYCEREGYAYVGRRKNLDSLSEKLESGRYNGWSDVDDLFGCTIVVPNLEREKTVLEYLHARFKCVELRARGKTRKSPDSFRFDATRFIGTLVFDTGTAPHPALTSLSFEVQIRSAFEHAWSVSMHGLTYKTDEIDWKRKRVAAQIKAMVEQLDQLIVSFETAASPVIESPWPETDFLKAIHEKFHRLNVAKAFPEESVPSSWSRFSENLYALMQASRAWPRNFDDRLPYVTECLDSIETGISNLKDFPRSISLHQLVLGILWDAKKLQPDLRGFTAVITSELEALFPSLRSCNTRFDFANVTN